MTTPIRLGVASENPLRLDFWLGKVDPRPLALFRIGFGLVLLHDLTDYLGNFRAWLTDDGMLPRSIPVDPWLWSVFHLTGSPWGAAAIYAVGLASIVLFTLGWFTRPATIVAWVFLASLHNRNVWVIDGGDDLARILMFWSMFGDLAGCWSLDVARGRRPASRVPAFPLRILQGHLAVLYLVAGILKARQGWFHGVGIYLALQQRGFVRPLGAFMAQSAPLCTLLTYVVVCLELAFFPLAFSPVFIKPARALAIATGVAVQMGIFVAMRVGIFTETMLWACVLYLQPEWLDWAETKWRARWRRMDPVLSSAAWKNDDAPLSPPMLAFGVVLLLQFVSTVWDPFLGTRIVQPRWLKAERTWLGLIQPMDLFGMTYDVAVWRAPGKLADGTEVDVLPVAAPGLVTQVGLSFSRWYKFTFKERERPIHYDALGRWLCTAYAERSPEGPLTTFTLLRDIVPIRKPGDPVTPPRRETLLEMDCATRSPR